MYLSIWKLIVVVAHFHTAKHSRLIYQVIISSFSGCLPRSKLIWSPDLKWQDQSKPIYEHSKVEIFEASF